MAITADQAGELAQAYQSGSGNLQDLVNQYGVSQADVNQYFPGFDVGANNLSLPSAPSSSPLASAPVAQTSSQTEPVNTSASPLSGNISTPNQLSGVVLAGDSWLANNQLNTPYIQKELGSTPVTNTAVGGSTSGDSLNQLNNFISGGGTFAPGTTVVLDAGGNDLLQGIPRDQIMKNLTQISQTLGAHGVNVILSGAPAVNNVSDVTGSTSLGVDPLYSQVASSNPNVTVVDAMSPLLNQKNLVDSSGFHMNNAGQMGYDTTLSDAVLKLQGKGPVTFTNADIAQFAKDNNLTTDQAIALAPSFGVSKDQVTQALASATTFSSPLSSNTINQTDSSSVNDANSALLKNTDVQSSGLSKPIEQLFNGDLTAKLVDMGHGQYQYTLPGLTNTSAGGQQTLNGSVGLDITPVDGTYKPGEIPTVYQIALPASGGGTMQYQFKIDPTTGKVIPNADPSSALSYNAGSNMGAGITQLASMNPITAPFVAAYNVGKAIETGHVNLGTALSALNAYTGLGGGSSGTLVDQVQNTDGSVINYYKDASGNITSSAISPSNLSTAKNALSAASAVENKNPLGVVNPLLNLTDTKVDPTLSAASKLGTALYYASKGNTNGVINTIMNYAKSSDPKVSATASKIISDASNGKDVTSDITNFAQNLGVDDATMKAIASLDPTALAQSGYGNNVATLASADPNFTPVSSPLSGEEKKKTDTKDTTTTDTTEQDTGGFTGGSAGYYQQQLDNLTNSGLPEDIARSVAKTLTNDAINKNQANNTSWVDPVTGELHLNVVAYGQNTNTGEGGMKSDTTPVTGASTSTDNTGSPLTGGSATGVANVKVDIDPNTGNKTEITTDPTTGLSKTTVTDPNGKVIKDTTSPLNPSDLNSINIVGKKIVDPNEIIDNKPPENPPVEPPVVNPPVVTPPVVNPPVVNPPVVNPPVVNPPVVNNPVTLPSTTTTKAPTSTSPLTSASPVGDKALPMVATMLAGAPVYNEKHQLAQLHQLYDSLDPHLARVLQQAGIIPPEPPKETKKSEEPTDIEKLMAESKASQPETAEPFLFAEGGSTFSDLVKNTEYKNIAPVASTMLGGAPVVQQESRISPLHHLKQSIRKDAQATSLLAHGGVPHKYRQAAPKGHNPEFITGLTGYYADGKGTGQSDDIPAMLHEGDYVMDADTVAAFGDGSSKAGAQVMDKFHHTVPHKMAVGGNPVPAKIADGEYVFPASFVTALGGGDNKLGSKLLDSMREELRAHKRSAPDTKIPPKAKSPLEYLKMAKG